MSIMPNERAVFFFFFFFFLDIALEELLAGGCCWIEQPVRNGIFFLLRFLFIIVFMHVYLIFSIS